MTPFDRAVAFMRTFEERLAERIVPTAHGKVLLTTSLPRVFWLNVLSVDLGARAGAEELAAEAEAVQGEAGLAHRKVAVDDQLGEELEPGFRSLGWTVERNLVMVHRGAAPPPALSVGEVGPEELEPAWAAGIRSSPGISDEEEVGQLVAAQHRRRIAVNVRYFAATVDGAPVSYCELFSDGQTAQIESVMTHPQARGRGLATAVVSRALEEAYATGHDFVFLCADAVDWPKELYRKLGFAEVASIWDFLRPPPRVS